MFLAGPKFRNLLASKLASDFRPFDPGIIIIQVYNINHLLHKKVHSTFRWLFYNGTIT